MYRTKRYLYRRYQQLFLPQNQFNLEHLTVGSNNYSLSNPTARCLFQDSFKNIWIGTYGGGVNFIKPLRLFSKATAILQLKIIKIVLLIGSYWFRYRQNNAKLWIGTDGGESMSLKRQSHGHL